MNKRLTRHGSITLIDYTCPQYILITVPLAALVRRGSLPLSSENLPAYCRVTSEGEAYLP